MDLQGIASGAKEIIRPLYRGRGIVYFLCRSSWDRSYPLLCLHFAYWIARAAITGERLFHFIGDSHTDPYRFEPRIITHHIGRGTAHNLQDTGSSSGSGRQLWQVLSGINRRRDSVGLVFGEIDCRVHFHYQYLKHNKRIPVSRLMDGTIKRYGSVIEKIRSQGFRLFVLGIPPAARQRNMYGYPFYGKPRERSKISRMFNSKLGKYCASRRIAYIDVYSQSADRNGFLMGQYAQDEVHLNKRIVPFVLGRILKP